MNIFKHQGDVTFFPLGENDFNDGKPTEHNGSFVLALGEQTGHKHVIAVEKPTDMVIHTLIDGNRIITLFGPATITHEEHKAITLSPGRYRVGKEKEKDWFSLSVRKVID